MEQQRIHPDLIDLRQGSYWRARGDIEFPEIRLPGVNYSHEEVYVLREGVMLLLESIRDVDHNAHTMILRPHPSEYGMGVWVKGVNTWGGEERECWKSAKLTEFRFLVSDFLDKFEMVEQPEPIRAKELAEAQDRIAQLQRKLLEGQTDPTVLRPVLEAGIDEWAKKNNLDPERAEYVATMPTATALVPTMTETHVDNLKLRISREHEIATLRADWIKGRVEEIGEAVQALMPYMQEQAAAALSLTEDVIRKVRSLQRGIESLDLYIGKNVTVETLKTGESAPAGMPLAIGQRKLFMQEEFSVWADVNDNFDFWSEKEFLKELIENESLRSQIFPGQRSIICMATRRTEKDYGDPWVNQAKNVSCWSGTERTFTACSPRSRATCGRCNCSPRRERSTASSRGPMATISNS